MSCDGYYAKKREEGAPSIRCIHCQRFCGTLAGGFARIGGAPVCSRPTEPDRPDCYRMITMKFHKLTDCPECLTTGLEFYPSPPRTGPKLPA